MPQTMRIVWVITLAFFTAGCSSYSVVYGPQDAENAAPSVGLTDAVETGDKVRVTLEDERRIEGKVASLSAESLTLEFGQPPRVDHSSLDDLSDYEIPPYVSDSTEIPADEMRVVEKRVASSDKTFFLVLGIVVGTVALMAVGLAISGGPMGNG